VSCLIQDATGWVGSPPRTVLTTQGITTTHQALVYQLDVDCYMVQMSELVKQVNRYVLSSLLIGSNNFRMKRVKTALLLG